MIASARTTACRRAVGRQPEFHQPTDRLPGAKTESSSTDQFLRAAQRAAQRSTLCYAFSTMGLMPSAGTAGEILDSLRSARLDPGLEPNMWEPSRPEPESIGVSLSGGGYRAALFGLGALLAIVDGQVGDRVRWVASVSGGSLASALVASGGGLASAQVPFDSLVHRALVAASHAGKITKRGVERSWKCNPAERPLLRDLGGGTTEHVFVAVDLLTRQPAFFSRSFYFSEGLRDEDRAWGRASSLRVSEIVRGSAGFPGLPPIRLASERFDRDNSFAWPERGMVLSDGGLWNNLATTWDADRRRIVNLLSGTMSLPAGLGRDVDLHLVVDASIPVRPSRFPSSYRIPVLGYIPALVGQAGTLFESAVYAHRRLIPVGSSKVTFEESPEYIDPVACNYLGGDRPTWASTSEFCEQIRTVAPTLRGIRRVVSVLLVTYGYALTAAHLAQHGVDNGRFRTIEVLSNQFL